MDLRDYLAVLRERWRIVAICTVLGTTVLAVVTLMMTPIYESRSQSYVSFQSADPSITALLSGSSYTRNQMTSYVNLATSPVVLEGVIDELGLDTTPSALAADITVSSPSDTALIDVLARSAQPETAADVSNAVTAELMEVLPELERQDGASTSPVSVTVTREAVASDSPASPNATLNIMLGMLTGAFAGIGLAVLRHALDTKIRTESDVASVTEAPVIATIGDDDDAPNHPLIVQTSPRSMRSEAFRHLRTNLQFLDVGTRSRAIVVTSALPGEGKSTTTINLAISLADAGSRVALIDADLRRPSIAEYMGLESQVGLTTYLIGRASLEDVLQPWGNERLNVITSGQTPPNPSELLGSHAMATMIKELAELYDVVLLDTAPLLPVTDGAVLTRLSAGALVVAGADKIHDAQLRQALARLSGVDARVLGIVLNRASHKTLRSYSYYSYGDEIDSNESFTQRLKSRKSRKDRAPAQIPRHSTSPLRREPWDEDTQSGTSAASKLTGRWPGPPIQRQS